MKLTNLTNYLTYIPKKMITGLVAAALVALPVMVAAGYAPADRPVFDWNDPADRQGASEVVFNSFINTPDYGDERAFFDGKNAAVTQPGGFQDSIAIEPGDEYLLRIYVHNNGNQDLNGPNLDGPTVAENARVRVFLPTATASNLRSIGYISADNARPGVVSDTVDFTSDQPVALEYVDGSATFKNNVTPNGRPLDGEALLSEDGVQLGYQQLNGSLPGCFAYDGFVSLRVKAVAPELEFKKLVRLDGDSEWKDSVKAMPGDEVEWLLSYQNTGDGQIDNVTLRDQLPPHVALVPGTVSLTDAKRPNGLELTDGELFTSGGVNVGSYTAGSNGYIRFDTKIKASDDFDDCVTTIRNTAWAKADDIPESVDQAEVIVTRTDCDEEVPPETPPETPPAEQPPREEVPVVIAATGPAETALGLFASGGLGIAIRSWLGSRRKLLASLLGN